MSWASRRKGLYIGTSSLIVALIIGGIGYLIFSHTPTCSDNIQNGTETGVDCGGACTRICKEDARTPTVLWARTFMVVPGTYTAAASFENLNKSAYVRVAHYTFQLRDSNNDVIAEREGVTAIPPGRVTVAVEANISTGNRVPVKVFFKFKGDMLVWERGDAPNVQVTPDPLDVTARRETVRVANASGREIDKLPVTVVLYDVNDTAIAASKSIIDRLQKDETETVDFTWPSAFTAVPVRAQVQALAIPW
jgi:hypothetical protein